MMIMASFFFSLMAPLIKRFNHLPLMELVFFRNLPTIFILPWLIKFKGISILGKNKQLLFLRAIFGFITMIGFIFTFMKMNLTEAMALRQLSPFIIIIFSYMFLREKLNSNQISIFILAFFGALLIIKPGFRYDMLPAIIGIISVFSAALAHTVLRQLRLTDHPLVIVYYFAFLSGIISIIFLVIQKNFQFPTGMELFLLISLGIASLFAQITLSYAYRLAPANVVSLYLYSRVFFTAVLDFLFFQDLPDYFTIIGCILITIGGYVHFRNKVNKKIQENGV